VFSGCEPANYSTPKNTIEFLGSFYRQYDTVFERNFEDFWWDGYIVSGITSEIHFARYDAEGLFYKGDREKVKSAFDLIDRYKDLDYKLMPARKVISEGDPEAKVETYSIDVQARRKLFFNFLNDEKYSMAARIFVVCGYYFPEDDEYRGRIATVYSSGACKILGFSFAKDLTGLCKVSYSRKALDEGSRWDEEEREVGDISEVDGLVPSIVHSKEECEAQASEILKHGTSEDDEVRGGGGLGTWLVRAFEPVSVEWTYFDSGLNEAATGVLK
ncbi:MAG: hypothetical protein AB1540_14130, partial [Bdellovibrionota bacterium]